MKKPKFLYHGSRNRIEVLKPRLPPKDMPHNSKKGVYATDNKNYALGMGLASKNSEAFRSRKTSQINFIKGPPRHKYVYLHVVDSKDFKKSFRDEYVATKAIKPVKIMRFEVAELGHLWRKSSKKELKEFLKDRDNWEASDETNMKPKLVILRGKPTSGKSTAWHALRKRKELQDWVFVDHCSMKESLGREKGGLRLYKELKKVLKSGKNIMIEETSEKTIRKYINSEIEKFGYEIVVFQFEISFEEAKKRNVQRSKVGWHEFIEEKKLKSLHEYHDEKIDKNAVLVDGNKLGKEKVVELILKNLN